MIGVIYPNKVFEFKNIDELANSFNWYVDKHGCDVLIIVDSCDRVKGILYRGEWQVMPNIVDDELYTIYGTTSFAISNYNIYDISRDDYLPNIRDWQLGPIKFKYISTKVPKNI